MPCVQLAQLPPLPHAVDAVPSVHRPLWQQYRPPQEPLPTAPHAAVQRPPAQVGAPLPHTKQPPPLPPHAPFWAPPTHRFADEQQPPLQGVWSRPPHAVSHWPVPRLHERPAGHSAALCPVQPQAPPRHTLPVAELLQSAHTSPPPQAVEVVPVTHVPALMPVGMRQHPPLHADCALHEAVQVPVAVLHAIPVAQSLARAQPHTPLGRHAWPVALAPQSMHTPLPPHALDDVPGWHMPPEADEQQPDRHALVDEQVKLQAWLCGSQPALLLGQSPLVLQPH